MASPPVAARRAPGKGPRLGPWMSSWLVMAVVLVVALALGSRTVGGGSDQDRVRAVASTIKCPQCAGQSAASSDAPTAEAIRRDIADRLAKGQSPDRIRDFYASRYGEGILLNPARSGPAGLVWVLPVVAAVLAFAGLGFAFRRWQQAAPAELSAEDRRLVAAARRARLSVGEPDGEPVDPHGEGDGR